MNCNELQEHAKPACYVVKKPRALQWFYKDQLCKESEEERQAGRFELFLDLLCEFISSPNLSKLSSPLRRANYPESQLTHPPKTSPSSPTSVMSSPNTPTGTTSSNTCSFSRQRGTSGSTCARS